MSDETSNEVQETGDAPITPAAPKSASLQSPDATGTAAPKRRGRPKGSKNKPKPANARGTVQRTPKPKPDVVQVDPVTDITLAIEGIHEGLAMLVDPGCRLSHEQANAEARAIYSVASKYEQSDKLAAMLPWIMLIGVVASCEIPTIMIVGNKVKAARQNVQNGKVIPGELVVIDND